MLGIPALNGPWKLCGLLGKGDLLSRGHAAFAFVWKCTVQLPRVHGACMVEAVQQSRNLSSPASQNLRRLSFAPVVFERLPRFRPFSCSLLAARFPQLLTPAEKLTDGSS